MDWFLYDNDPVMKELIILNQYMKGLNTLEAATRRPEACNFI